MVISIDRNKPLSAIALLAMVNVLFFAILLLCRAVANLSGHDAAFSEILPWICCSSNISDAVSRPWTLVSYSIVHLDLTHALLNILWLIWFGSIAMRYGIISRSITLLYAFAAIAGAAAYITASNMGMPSNGILIGSSASVLAIATAAATYKPNDEVSIPLLPKMKIYIPVAIMIVAEALMVTKGNTSGHICHIAGISCGFLAGLVWRRNKSTGTESSEAQTAISDKILTSGFESLSADERSSLIDK